MADESVEHHEVIIVGGGTSGLYTAHKLINSGGIDDVIVLESRGFVGGRIVTTRDNDNKKPLFNNFAWRVSEANPMMLQLARELDIKLVPQFTPPPIVGREQDRKCKHGPLSCDRREEHLREVPKNRPPLSDFAKASLNSSTEADLQDRESGYAGRTSQVGSKVERKFLLWQVDLCSQTK